MMNHVPRCILFFDFDQTSISQLYSKLSACILYALQQLPHSCPNFWWIGQQKILPWPTRLHLSRFVLGIEAAGRFLTLACMPYASCGCVMLLFIVYRSR